MVGERLTCSVWLAAKLICSPLAGVCVVCWCLVGLWGKRGNGSIALCLFVFCWGGRVGMQRCCNYHVAKIVVFVAKIIALFLVNLVDIS